MERKKKETKKEKELLGILIPQDYYIFVIIDDGDSTVYDDDCLAVWVG